MSTISMSASRVAQRIVSGAAPVQMAGDNPCAVEAERIVDEIEADADSARSAAMARLSAGDIATEVIVGR